MNYRKIKKQIFKMKILNLIKNKLTLKISKFKI